MIDMANVDALMKIAGAPSDNGGMTVKKSGAAIRDYLTFGPDGAAVARREQILNEEAEARSDPRHSNADPRGHALREVISPLTSLATSRLAGAGIGAIAAKLSGRNWHSKWAERN